MIPELKDISDKTINDAWLGLNELLIELKELHGEGRFYNDFYIDVLSISMHIDSEMFKRERNHVDKASVNDKGFDYKDRIKEN